MFFYKINFILKKIFKTESCWKTKFFFLQIILSLFYKVINALFDIFVLRITFTIFKYNSDFTYKAFYST